MKNLLFLGALLISVTALSQDTYFQNGSEQLEEKAITITDRYVYELGLRAKQELLFRKKVEEYLIKEEKIKATFSGEAMLAQMVALRQSETAEMGDILTRLQLQKYKEIRPEVQPLARVEQ